MINVILIIFIFSLNHFSQNHYYSFKSLNANNIIINSDNIGSLSRYPTGSFAASWEILQENKTILFDQGLWVIGKVDGEIRMSISQWGSTYSPGPMINGNAAMLENPSDSLRYRVYKISKGDDNTNPDYAEWPVDFGAPVNSLGEPLVFGDQTLFSVYNGVDSTISKRNFWNNAPYIKTFPVEIAQTFYSRSGNLNDSEDVFSNVVFMEYTIVNGGNSTIDSVFIGLWNDIDYEPIFSNKPGVDVERNLGFIWTNQSENFIPPSVGYKLLYGPVVDSPGETAVFKGRTINNKINLPLHSFRGISDDATIHNLASPAHSLNHVWNYSRGLDRAGNNYVDPTNNQITKFPFNGDPVTNQGWLFGFANGGGAGFTLFCGPFTLEPQDTNWVMFALIPALGNSNLNSFEILREKSDYLASLPYDSLAFGKNGHGVTNVNDNKILLFDFSLEQNYPNPFNPSTEIRYQITEDSKVLLKIYDILGNEVATLVNENQSTGKYNINYNASNLSSGVYFYQLSAVPSTGLGQVFIETKKMLLMK